MPIANANAIDVRNGSLRFPEFFNGAVGQLLGDMNVNDDWIVNDFEAACILPTNVELRLDVGTGPRLAISRPRPRFFQERP